MSFEKNSKYFGDGYLNFLFLFDLLVEELSFIFV